jgi:1-acyl-sn-glycerol-3-phosphate acyltransferase
MIRALITRVLHLALRLFFRRVDVAGTERVPARGPTIFAINHPNGLVDPVLLLCYSPRPVSFLGKAPLFRMPVIGWFVRALDSIPVYRRQDPGNEVSHNRDTFARARALLDRGGTIAIAPEGTSHDDPRLRPLKTGAARIALGAGTAEPVAIVPVGLFYTEKAVFRSAALVYFGAPLSVAAAPLDAAGEPPAERVAEVTATLEAALAATLVQADDHESQALVARAERLLTASLPGGAHRGLDEVVAVRQALIDGYRRLRESDPTLLDRTIRRIDRLEAAFHLARLDPGAVRPRSVGAGAVLRSGWWLVARIGAFLPLAIPGAVLHYPAYRLIGAISKRIAGSHDDVLATIKIIAAAVFYPLTWVAAAVAVGKGFGWVAGWLALVVAPLSGYAAVKLVERFDRFLSRARAFGFYLAEPEHFSRLAAERDELRADLLALAARLGVSVPTAGAGARASR